MNHGSTEGHSQTDTTGLKQCFGHPLPISNPKGILSRLTLKWVLTGNRCVHAIFYKMSHCCTFHNMSYFLYQAVECSHYKGPDVYSLPAVFLILISLCASTPDFIHSHSFFLVFIQLPGLCLHLSSFTNLQDF